MHPPTLPPSPLPTLSFSHHLTFSLLTFPLSPLPTFPFSSLLRSNLSQIGIFSLTLKQNL